MTAASAIFNIKRLKVNDTASGTYKTEYNIVELYLYQDNWYMFDKMWLFITICRRICNKEEGAKKDDEEDVEEDE